MIRLLILLAAFTLAACGGGESVALPKVAFYGDSITSGGGLSLRPVEEISRMAGVEGIDHSVGGMSVREATLVDDADLVVIRYAGADSMRFGAEGLPEFEASLRALVSSSKVPVILTGTVRVVKPDWMSAEDYVRISTSIDAYDATVKRVAAAMAVPFVDVRAVPFNGASDLRDYIHPAQAYSTRISAEVAKVVKTNVLEHNLGTLQEKP